MRILIADKFEAAGIDELESFADEVVFEPALKGETLKQKLREFNPNVLIVRSTKVPGEIMEGARDLKLIIRAGSGYDTIDTAGARQRGISVSNCPGMNAVAVAELAMGLIISLDRRIPDNVMDLRAHKWSKKEFSKARGLKGRTLGVVGAGRIGAEVVRRALAFDMNVIFSDVVPDLRPSDDPRCKRVELDELFRTADIITVHVPGGDATRHLVNAERLALMQPHAMLVNTSRATVVDERALIAALREGQIRAAGLDLFANEPPADGKTFDDIVADVPNLYGTHHIGASTEQAQLAVAQETVRIAREFQASGKVLNCVNA